MLSYRLVLYCDICIVSLKYFFTYGTLNLTFFYITLHYVVMVMVVVVMVVVVIVVCGHCSSCIHVSN